MRGIWLPRNPRREAHRIRITERSTVNTQVAIVLVATGPDYQAFARRLIPQIRSRFTTHPKTIFLVTDAVDFPEADHVLRVEHLPMPLPSLFRYHWICCLAHRLRMFSHLYYLDADLEIVDQIGDEVLQSVVAVRHYIWPTSELASLAPFEHRRDSAAYVCASEAKQYVQGSFQGGDCARYLEIALELRGRINQDLHRGPNIESLIGIWWDESHWNRWVNDNLQEVTLLPPEYALGDSGWSLLPQSLRTPIIRMVPKDVSVCWKWRATTQPGNATRRLGTELRGLKVTDDNSGKVIIPLAVGSSRIRFLDSLTPVSSQVAFGAVGIGGDLGYESKQVCIKGVSSAHSLSVHGPSRLLFDLGGSVYSKLTTGVGFNDDVSKSRVTADFEVYGDGRLLSERRGVSPGKASQEIVADLLGIRSLELVISVSRKVNAHTVWIDPQLTRLSVCHSMATLYDCLGAVQIMDTVYISGADLCIATIASEGTEALLDDMLGSLVANGNCPSALVVVFNIDSSESISRVVRKYGARSVVCRSRVSPISDMKSGLYSVATAVNAKRFICIGCDTLITGDIRPLADAIEVGHHNSVFICREANASQYRDLDHFVSDSCLGRPEDLERILGCSTSVHGYDLIVNDSVFAGSRQALLAMDSHIRAMPGAVQWIEESENSGVRSQFVLNLALAVSNAAVELSPTYNLQVGSLSSEVAQDGGRPATQWNGQAVKILNFRGPRKHRYSQIRGLYSRITDPLPFVGGGDLYGHFLKALRAWVGRHGQSVLRWSFYGTADAKDAKVPDSSVFPLFGQLHYLLRSNGVVSVLETGTARGVSTACLASAVAHREGARVVSFDVQDFPERHDLWGLLPEEFRKCIEPRMEDCIEGMKRLLESRVYFDLALLDTLHDASHVLREFQLARQLVKPGGLILIHDPCLTAGSVGQALRQIESEGFPVTRLWDGPSGIREDDHLGLALVQLPRV